MTRKRESGPVRRILEVTNSFTILRMFFKVLIIYYKKYLQNSTMREVTETHEDFILSHTENICLLLSKIISKFDGFYNFTVSGNFANNIHLSIRLLEYIAPHHFSRGF